MAAVVRLLKKWCRRGEIGKRGDLTHLWTSVRPSSNLGAGTHRTMVTCATYRETIAWELCEVSVAFSLRRKSREAIAFRLFLCVRPHSACAGLAAPSLCVIYILNT